VVPGVGGLPPWRALFVLACLPNLLLLLFAASVRLPATPPLARARLGTAFAWMVRRRGIYLPHFAASAAAVLMGRTLAAWGPTFYVRSHGMSPAESGITLGLLLLIGGPLGHVAAGLILDRIDPRRRRPAASWMLGLGLVLALPAVIVMTIVPDRAMSLTGFTLLTAILGFTAPAALSGVQWLTPIALRGRVSALFIAAVTLTASGTGPPLLGLLADTVYGADQLGRALITLFLLVGGPGILCAVRAARRAAPGPQGRRKPSAFRRRDSAPERVEPGRDRIDDLGGHRGHPGPGPIGQTPACAAIRGPGIGAHRGGHVGILAGLTHVEGAALGGRPTLGHGLVPEGLPHAVVPVTLQGREVTGRPRRRLRIRTRSGEDDRQKCAGGGHSHERSMPDFHPFAQEQNGNTKRFRGFRSGT
jgi:hypothetical protein